MRIRFLTAVSLISLTISSCSTLSPSPDAVKPATDAKQRVDINPDYKAGQVIDPDKTSKLAAPVSSLDDILAKANNAPKKAEPKKEEDRLRLPAMKEAATAYGAQSGLVYATRAINKNLETRADQLTKTYNFQKLMIQGPNDVMVRPPIVVEAQDAWESSDAGKTLRVADKVYEIIEQTEFTPTTPMWQNYLLTNFDPAPEPPDQLLPRDKDEREQWKKWVADGWQRGQQQAEETFQANLDRLNRDFNGMVRYKALLEEGKVSAPIIADGNLGTTGTGQNMRVNDRAIRITQDPALQVNNKQWDASVTTTTPGGVVKGPEATKPEVKPSPKPPHKKVIHNKKKVTSDATDDASNSSMISTSSGKGRF